MALAAGFVLLLAREVLPFAVAVFGLGVTLLALRFGACSALDAAFREGARLAAALPRLVVLAIGPASIRQRAPFAAFV
jgi:hypothetical protein